jgi:hypothetical protein
VIEVENLSEVPDEWMWACKCASEAEWNRLIGHLQKEQRADPTNVDIAGRIWAALDLRKSPMRALTCFGECSIASAQGCAALAHAFKELMHNNGVIPERRIFSDDLCTALRRSLDVLEGVDKEAVQWLISSMGDQRVA